MGAEPSTEAVDGEAEEESASEEEAQELPSEAKGGQDVGAKKEPPAEEADPEPPDPGEAPEKARPPDSGSEVADGADAGEEAPVKSGSSESLPAALEAAEAAEGEQAEPGAAEERDPRLDALGAADDLELPLGEQEVQGPACEEASEAPASPPAPEPAAAESGRQSSPSEPRQASSRGSKERSQSLEAPEAGQEEAEEQPVGKEVEAPCQTEEVEASVPDEPEEKPKQVEVPPPPPPPRPPPPPSPPRRRRSERHRRSEGRGGGSPQRKEPPTPPSPPGGRRPKSEERQPSQASRRRQRVSPSCSRGWRSRTPRRRWRSGSPSHQRSRQEGRRRRRRRWRGRSRRSRSASSRGSSRRDSSRGSSRGSSRSRSRSKDRSRPRSRSRSRSQNRSPRRRSGSPRRSQSPREDPSATVLRFVPGEAAFLVGKNHGAAVRNIAKASNTEGKLSHNNRVLTLSGTERDRARAKRYVGFVLMQMDRPVRLDDGDIDEDCSMVQVPDVAVGFVTGTNGAHLRRVEEEWGVIMMFSEYLGRSVVPAAGSGPARRCETLAIFGPRRGRRGAQLTMMNVIEGKVTRHFSAKIRQLGELYHPDDVDDQWGTTTLEVREEIMPYALGKNGGTRRKLMLASGCIVQYLGNFAIMSGTKQEQTRASEYLTWLLQTLDGPVHVPNLDSRNDVTLVEVPGRIVGFIKGTRRESLSRHEEDWGVLMLFVGEHGQHGFPQQDGVVHLLIFGGERSRKGAEIDIMCAMEFKQKGWCTSRLSPRSSDREGFDVERIQLNEVEVSYALGMKGETRKKLAAASGAIIQFVGTVCCIAGERPERQRCKDYLGWLLGRLKGQTCIDTRGRSDVTEIHVRAPNSKAMGVVTGKKGHTLQGVAKETGTWCVVAKDHSGQERLCIFGHVQGSWTGETGRRKAERLFRAVLKEARAFAEADRRRGGKPRRNGAPRNRPQQRGDSRPRSRSSASRSSSGGRSAERSRSRSPLGRAGGGRPGGWDNGRW